ncbi:basic amino acid ABC transporter substrate-binding protein [Brachyspira hyodysenteriae]|uniref:basic amino acid ABC transporter substrate-binding protein n=1 Tax=Brachyspira hyodysenteriae TaxID=159 RepID=UPI00063DD71B|nr:basic amino acid ABC transporter substrate-binding protein [Brachyspira hyodysenteriae]KLI46721.1 amino acid ABC transporter substrate-binding protein [Brachyspira hyodysenteriae]
MFKNNIVKILAALSIVLVLFISCKKKEEKNKLYVGTNAEFVPFEYREGDKIVGFDMDLIAEAAKLIGKEIEIVDMQFDGLLPALEAKKIDIIAAGMTATEERKKFVNFTDPYYESKQTILVHSDNKDIYGFDSLEGKNVGVVLGYTGDLIVSEMSNVNVQRYSATSEAVIALKSQKVDAVVLDSEPAKQYFNQNNDLKLVISLTDEVSSEEYAIAMRKEDTELLAQMNEALKTLKENGTYDALISKYFGE